jgi:hypothetical protein
MMKFRFTRHAIQRMAERGIGVEMVESIVRTGLIITHYKDDRPYPSCLVLGFDADKPWHVVYSTEGIGLDAVAHVITVYQPNPAEWDASLTKRKDTQ